MNIFDISVTPLVYEKFRDKVMNLESGRSLPTGVKLRPAHKMLISYIKIYEIPKFLSRIEKFMNLDTLSLNKKFGSPYKNLMKKIIEFKNYAEVRRSDGIIQPLA